MIEKIIRRSLLMLGLFALFFQAAKAIGTGFWLDEAWISRLVWGYLHGYGWREVVWDAHQFVRGIYFNGDITNGPTLLVPALLLSVLQGKIIPPVLHLFVLSHVILIWFALKLLRVRKPFEVLAIYLSFATWSSTFSVTQFLGEFPGACWFLLGCAAIALALSEPQKENLVYLAGFSFGLSVLTKLVFLIPALLLLLTILILEKKNFRLLLKLGFAGVLPIFLWGGYQLFHVKSWSLFLDAQRSAYQHVLDPSFGAGLSGIKSISSIWGDLKKLLQSGPAYWVFFLFFLLGFWVYQARLASAEKKWIFFCWITSVSGIGWWFFLSDYRFHGSGALIRHSAIFIHFSLVAFSLVLYHALHQLPQVRWDRWWVAGLGLCLIGYTMLFCIRYGIRSVKYFVHWKDYGNYSAWYDQKKLSEWIGEYGSRARPLPILNCDQSISNDLLSSHVKFPQQVLSSGLFEMFPCETKTLEQIDQSGPLVVLKGTLAPTPAGLELELISGKSDRLGLWRLQETRSSDFASV